MRFLMLLLLGCTAAMNGVLAQEAQQQLTLQTLPKVINVAENSEALDLLSEHYQSSLFSASKTDFRATVSNWRGFLLSMEAYAEQIDFDIKGVKVWLKVFWAKDGNVDYMAYALSGRSINIDQLEWEAFLRSFMRNKKLAIRHQRTFTYDGRIMFPLSYQQPQK